ncbi:MULTISPECIES: hypothetical protein [unclassified Streptomyces]|uniref:hypothetical protein n=1 Tax=unclassified Streptomyces TaxID=2593676 RepID=UPI002E2C6FEC|nr:hypothetical protein [Streptomyces sp. NBC_01429]
MPWTTRQRACCRGAPDQTADPKKFPANTTLEEAPYEGRRARNHVLCNGRACGCGLALAAREQFATVILARSSASAWQRLASKSSPLPGRGHAVQDGIAGPARVLLRTGAEATD